MPTGLCICFICGKLRKHQRENLKLYGENVAYYSLGHNPSINFCIKCHQKYQSFISKFAKIIRVEHLQGIK